MQPASSPHPGPAHPAELLARVEEFMESRGRCILTVHCDLETRGWLARVSWDGGSLAGAGGSVEDALVALESVAGSGANEKVEVCGNE